MSISAELARRAIEELPDDCTIEIVARFLLANFPDATLDDLEAACVILDEIDRQESLEGLIARGTGS